FSCPTREAFRGSGAFPRRPPPRPTRNKARHGHALSAPRDSRRRPTSRPARPRQERLRRARTDGQLPPRPRAATSGRSPGPSGSAAGGAARYTIATCVRRSPETVLPRRSPPSRRTPSLTQATWLLDLLLDFVHVIAPVVAEFIETPAGNLAVLQSEHQFHL